MTAQAVVAKGTSALFTPHSEICLAVSEQKTAIEKEIILDLNFFGILKFIFCPRISEEEKFHIVQILDIYTLFGTI